MELKTYLNQEQDQSPVFNKTHQSVRSQHRATNTPSHHLPLLLPEPGIFSWTLLALLTHKARTGALLGNFATTILTQHTTLYILRGTLTACKEIDEQCVGEEGSSPCTCPRRWTSSGHLCSFGLDSFPPELMGNQHHRETQQECALQYS